MAVEIKGEGKGGGAIHDEGLDFSLFYNCKEFKGETIITVELEIPPFNKAKFSYIKECKKVDYGINIGTMPN